MFNSAVLETVIGVVFVLVLFSTVCAAVREAIEGLLKSRAAYLEHGIRELLDDKGASGLVKEIYTHPLISGLFAGNYVPVVSNARTWWSWGRRNLPSYIPSKNFAAALLDLAARGPVGQAVQAGQPVQVNLDALRQSAANIGNDRIARVLLNAIDLSEGDINKAAKHIEAWFDSGMDRVSGWYKRLSSRIIFAIALVLAVVLNVDLIAVSRALYQDTGQRSMLVAYAQGAVSDPAAIADRKAAFDRLADKSFPIGWNDRPVERIVADLRIGNFFGWVFTAFAATLGAPFWFDVLNRMMVIRATVKPHEKSREERSQDS